MYQISDYCKYCKESVEDLKSEGLKCEKCAKYVHLNCLKRGSVPGGLTGDIFYTFVCLECSDTDQESFQRDRMPWFQAIVLVLYHVNIRNPGLARRGYFHWKMHLATLIDKNWDILFNKDFKRKKKWIGTISGSLSHYSPCFFHSGTTIFGDQGWWTLTFPKLTPNVLIKLNAELMVRKVKMKEKMIIKTDFELLKEIMREKYEEEYLQSVFDLIEAKNDVKFEAPIEVVEFKKEMKPSKKFLLPTLESLNEGNPKKLFKTNGGNRKSLADSSSSLSSSPASVKQEDNSETRSILNVPTFLDPMCHYNTSLNSIAKMKGMQIRMKLMGGLREETLLSPYSSLYLKPYIRRDVVATPTWLKMMAQIQLKANGNNRDYVLPPRTSIDYVYVQPMHIPAVNSLCNQFFWPGIDLTECLQYPDFSCIVLYKKLIVGFAFIVPDVKLHENYVSFVFVRPGWRNAGIGRFMMYHLIQTSTGKDVTLHVSINNAAFFLYQKFGFKVENVELNFYDKYYRSDAKESKHAFFCRLER